MEDTITITTPNGYVATLKKTLTYGQYKAFQAILTKGMKFDVANKRVSEMDGSIVMEATNKALEFLLVKLTDKIGNVIENPVQALDTLDAAEGMAIFDKVNEITDALTPQKKSATE